MISPVEVHYTFSKSQCSHAGGCLEQDVGLLERSERFVLKYWNVGLELQNNYSATGFQCNLNPELLHVREFILSAIRALIIFQHPAYSKESHCAWEKSFIWSDRFLSTQIELTEINRTKAPLFFHYGGPSRDLSCLLSDLMSNAFQRIPQYHSPGRTCSTQCLHKLTQLRGTFPCFIQQLFIRKYNSRISDRDVSQDQSSNLSEDGRRNESPNRNGSNRRLSIPLKKGK